jgi:sugar lactone lactonase YvrE
MSEIIEAAGPHQALLGESPLWHVEEQCLYYVDIPGRQVLRLDPASGALKQWPMDSEPGCIARLAGGGLLVARRDGLWRLDTATDVLTQIAPAPYDSARQRFNDGKPDAQGRFWVGTIDDARLPESTLYCYADAGFQAMAGGIVTSNGLAWSPDQRRLYWSDTKAHEVYQLDFDPASGAVSNRRIFARFAPRAAGQSLEGYGGRPDGAAVDAEGCYWVAMFEGQRLLRFSPQGELLQTLRLPVRCPTMPTFGGADLCTLYITTAREKRPAEELAAQPWAGCVLQLRVEVPGLPAQIAQIARSSAGAAR